MVHAERIACLSTIDARFQIQEKVPVMLFTGPDAGKIKRQLFRRGPRRRVAHEEIKLVILD
jgi:hypothetical protein